ncbi:hypothetical protein HDU97_010411 [Phlyctochytrium planicorne]|nr:hypothetical protein HDU97_010411 [Phlyctochytrium planicorne]
MEDTSAAETRQPLLITNGIRRNTLTKGGESPSSSLSSPTALLKACELCQSNQHGVADCPRLTAAGNLLNIATTAELQKAGMKDSEIVSIKKRKTPLSAKVSIPWLLKFYPVIAIVISCMISIPLAFYKWNLAFKEEEREARRSFGDISDNIARIVKKNWEASVSGSTTGASFYFSQSFGGSYLFNEAWQNFTNTQEFFTLLSKNIAVGLYQGILPEERAAWEDRYFKTYGPNLGSNSTFTIYTKLANGTKVKENPNAEIFATSMMSNIQNPSNLAAIGYNIYSEKLQRGPAIDKMKASGSYAVTGRTQLTRSVTPAAGVVIMTPIFMNTTTKAITRNKTDRLFAIAFTSFETQEVLKVAMQSYTISDYIDVFLFDTDGYENNTFLAHYSNQDVQQYDNYTLAVNLAEKNVLDAPYDVMYTEEIYTLTSPLAFDIGSLLEVAEEADWVWRKGKKTKGVFAEICAAMEDTTPETRQPLLISGGLRKNTVSEESPSASSPSPLLRVCDLCQSKEHNALECPRLAIAVNLLNTATTKELQNAGMKDSEIVAIRKKPMPLSSKVSIPWLLRFYPVIAIVISCMISIPLAFYKWNLAFKEEEREARRSFGDASDNVARIVKKNWEQSVTGSTTGASFYFSQSFGGSYFFNEAWQNFTNTQEFFTLLSKNIAVGIYQGMTPQERPAWEDKYLKTYGPNLGSKTTYSIYKKFANGTKVKEDPNAEVFAISMMSNIQNPSNLAATGYNVYSDKAQRGPAIDKMKESGSYAVTGRMQLTRSVSAAAGVSIMTPIFMNTTTKTVTRNKTDYLFAIAFTSFETQEVLRLAMQSYTISDYIDVFLFDMDGFENNTFLAHYSNVEVPDYDNYT